MELLMDSVKVIGRIITILPFLLFLGLYMGKRSIGELPVFDFLVILVLGAVVGADIADPKIDHIHTVIAMLVIALLQKLITFLKLRNRKIGGLLTFEPTIVVFKGKFLSENMKKINYSIVNILQMLREKNIFRVSDVEIAVIEANGKISASLSSEKQTVTVEDMKLSVKEADFEIPVILDGKIQEDTLTRLNKDKDWIKNKLAEYQIGGEKEVFYAGVNSKGDLNLTIKGRMTNKLPPILH